MPEDNNFVFRGDDEERLVIAERNKQAAASILSQAGISEDNPLYNQYYAHTLANVHHAGRYGGYDKSIEQMFVQTLKDPELSLEQYKEASKRFEAQFAEKQMQNAEGSIFDESKNNTPFQELRNILNQTTRDGVEMRQAFNTTFPKEFYDENGHLRRRLVVEIPPEMMENSAMGAIGVITKEYKNISFDKASNSFMVKGKPVGPEKFFKNKKEMLDKFDAEKLDMDDAELLSVLQEGDYNKFLELRKNRGMNRDRRNEMLRNILNDEVVLGEVSKKFRTTELNKQNISDVVKSVADDFGNKAQIVRTEAEKATLGGIDRVMFSISAADVARQSTFQDWKSCMHAVGCNHQYVDDSIGVGSIIAYGYSSDNPQKMVSRLLIHPYKNDKGEVAYAVNDRIYGKENLAFRNVVDQVVSEKFNEGKIGTFKFNSKLYNDNAGKSLLTLFPSDLKNVNLKDFAINGRLDLGDCWKLNLQGVDLAQVEAVKMPRDIKSLDGIRLPRKVDLNNCSELNLVGSDLSYIEEVTLPREIKSLDGIRLPKKVDLSNCSELSLVGSDLLQVGEVKLPREIKSLEGIQLPKKVDLSDCLEINLQGVDLSQANEVKMPHNIKSLEKIKLPKKVDLSFCSDVNLQGMDFSQVEAVKMPRNIKSLEEIKLPKKVDLGTCYNINLAGVDLSQIEELTLPHEIKSLKGTKLPKKVDLSDSYNVNLADADLSSVENLKISTCENLDLSSFNGNLEFSQKQFAMMNSKLPPSLNKLDLSDKMALISATDLNGIEELKLPEHVIVGSLDDAENKIMELCNGDDSNLEKLSAAVITPESVPNNLKKLDISLCKDADLRNWNLDKIEELKLPKDFDVSKLPEGILEKNPAVSRAVKIAHGEILENVEQVAENTISEPKVEAAIAKSQNEAADYINQLRGVKSAQVASPVGENVLEQAAEKTAVHAGVHAGKASEGIVGTLAKADNAVNRVIDKTVDKGSNLLNNTTVGKAYEKATNAVANTKVVKTVQKSAAKTVEKAAQTAVGKSVVKAVAKTTGSAVGKSVLKKIPVVSVAAGCYFAWDRVKDGDWKGACGEVASGIAGCFPGLGTGVSAAIDVGLAAKDISGAITESQEPETPQPKPEERHVPNKEEQRVQNNEEMRQLVLQKQGRVADENKTPVQSSEISNQVIQHKISQRVRE